MCCQSAKKQQQKEELVVLFARSLISRFETKTPKRANASLIRSSYLCRHFPFEKRGKEATFFR